MAAFPKEGPAQTITVIEPPSGWSLPRFAELRNSADLVYFLAKRDVSVRYKQTAVGALWAILQPVLLAGVFSLFFGRVADVPSEGAPYGLFALTGMTIWLFLSTAIARCAESTVNSSTLISKVYFPRVAIPIAAVLPPVVDFMAAFAVLVLALFVFGEVPELKIMLAPAVFLVAVAIALGAGFWLSAIIVRYRDVSHAITFLTTVLLFVTPILYPLSVVPEAYQAIYALNPLVGVLETFRWTILPDAGPPGLLVLTSAAAGVVLIVTGLAYFHRVERRFADII